SPEGTRRISISVEPPARGLIALKGQPGVLDATLVESEIHLLVPTDLDPESLRPALEGLEAGTFRPISPSLEDVFVTITRRLAKE
ncbi:MAG TPA: hypothetical protein VGE01_10125, partial [Fimbriimonas sp.]